MPVRKANAEWKGDLKNGSGEVRTESGALDSAYSFSARFESGGGTNPEELIGAAQAACYSMFLASELSKAGHTVDSVRTEANVHLEKGDSGFSVTRIELACHAQVPGIDDKEFQEFAASAKEDCPISNALASVPIELEARLN